ncbi:hypothetical protein JCM9279_003519 [Rhodotorula babjevae]
MHARHPWAVAATRTPTQQQHPPSPAAAVERLAAPLHSPSSATGPSQRNLPSMASLPAPQLADGGPGSHAWPSSSYGSHFHRGDDSSEPQQHPYGYPSHPQLHQLAMPPTSAGRRGSVFHHPSASASPSPFEPTRPYPLSTSHTPNGGLSAASAQHDDGGNLPRKRSWAETVDGAARSADDQARSRPPPGVQSRGSAAGGGGDDERHYRRASDFEGGGGRGSEVPPSPLSAGAYAPQHASYYGGASGDAQAFSPSTLAPPSYMAYRRGSMGLAPSMQPLYSPNRAAHNGSPSNGYLGSPSAASHLPSPMSHPDSRLPHFSPQPPLPSLNSYHHEQPEAYAASLPTSSTPGPNWAPQRNYSFDGPSAHSLPYRPVTSASLVPPHAATASSADFPPYSPAPSTSSRPSYPGGTPFSYSAQSPAPSSAASRPPTGQPMSYLESPSYPAGQQVRPATTSSVPSLGLSMQAPPAPFDPYHHEPQPTAYSAGPPQGAFDSPASALPPPPVPYPYASTSAPRSSSFDAASHPASNPNKPPSPPPTIFPETVPQLQQASSARAMHRSAAPILAFNPAREPASTGKQLVQSSYGVTYAVASSGHSKGKAKSAEVGAVCYTCGQHRAKVICRGSDLSGWAPRLSYSCLDCLPLDEQKPVEEDADARRERLADRAFEADCAAEAGPSERSPTGSATSAATTGSALLATLPGPSEHDRATFKDSFSGAVDFLEGAPPAPSGSSAAGLGAAGSEASRLTLPPEETSRGLPAHLKRQALTCDVCDRTIGAGSISSLTQGPPPAFTVEVICNACADKYKPCSDCGGGGGRLTPGRWRCKELFPAGRRTCTLSHARNPPLSDIDYDVLRITEIDPHKLQALEARCRLVYFNTRLRTQARPEMLERGDGLATTYGQCEKLVVDGWSLLSPLMSVDVEQTRGIRRYVAVQTSTPHRRRAKPKPGAAPRPEPEIEDPLEKEVSGFLIVEHDLKNGATFVAVTMPWAISGDAFDATTILLDETVKRIRTDLRHDNAVRREHGEAPFPEPWCLWGVTPFKADSRMTQSLSRRSFVFLEDYLRDKPDTDLSIFPPTREIHIPNEFVKTFKIFLRDMTEDDGNGQPVAAGAGGKKQPRQRARKLKQVK